MCGPWRGLRPLWCNHGLWVAVLPRACLLLQLSGFEKGGRTAALQFSWLGMGGGRRKGREQQQQLKGAFGILVVLGHPKLLCIKVRHIGPSCSDYEYLREHFREKHFLCEEGRCSTEQFTHAFRTEIDYKAHKTACHSKNRAEARQNRQIDLQFSYAPRHQRRNEGMAGWEEQGVEEGIASGLGVGLDLVSTVSPGSSPGSLAWQAFGKTCAVVYSAEAEQECRMWGWVQKALFKNLDYSFT